MGNKEKNNVVNEVKNSFYSTNLFELSETGKKVVKVEVLRVGKIYDHDIEITDQMLSDFVDNYKAGVYGVELQMNLGHQREGEAGGWIKDLTKEGSSLFAFVELTKLGEEKVEELTTARKIITGLRVGTEKK